MKAALQGSRRGDALSRVPVEVWTTDLEGAPPVRAWERLGVGPRPARLELLRRRQKSIVYRLPGVGPGATDVIAKQCLGEIARDERAVYEALDQLGIAALDYHGYVTEPTGEFGWIFVEDAAGAPWDPEDPDQRRAAARFLARLHVASSRGSAGGLPDRDLGWFRDHLDGARRRIVAGFDNPLLAAHGPPLLDAMLRLLDGVERCWPALERACAGMPRALVHGDFADRNVRIRREGSQTQVLAFDWEIGGWGLPAVDMAHVDIATYAEAVRGDWQNLDEDQLARFAHLGHLLRGGVAATSWASESLATTYPERALRDFPHYERRILRALAALDLAPEEEPA